MTGDDTQVLEAAVRAPDHSPSKLSPAGHGVRNWGMPLVVGGWKYLLGVFLCQSLLLSVLVVGWVYRWMQRVIVMQWYRASRVGEPGGFVRFAGEHASSAGLCRWPNWLVEPAELFEKLNRPPGFRRLLARAGSSLRANFVLGLGGILNTWVLTWPACGLWVFAWMAGWNNSFDKVYEESYLGALTGWLGSLLFIGAMCYVPLAQARHASTGDWRSFYDFRLIGGIARNCWLACLILAALYALVGAPLMVAKSLPLFFTEHSGIAEQLAKLGPREEREFVVRLLSRYYFWVTFATVPAYLLLRFVAAKLYANGLVHGIASGRIGPNQLGEFEREQLERLQLLEVRCPAEPTGGVVTAVGRSIGRTSGRLAWLGGCAAMAGLWFIFVAEIFVGQFFNYTMSTGWMNQPLVHLPVLRYIPW